MSGRPLADYLTGPNARSPPPCSAARAGYDQPSAFVGAEQAGRSGGNWNALLDFAARQGDRQNLSGILAGHVQGLAVRGRDQRRGPQVAGRVVLAVRWRTAGPAH